MTNRPTDEASAELSEEATTKASTEDFFAAIENRQNNGRDDEVLIRKRKRKKAKRKKLRVAALIAIVLVALIGASAWAFYSAVKAGEKSLTESNQDAQVETEQNAVTYDEGKTVSYNGHTYKLNENIVSVAVIGFDRTAPALEGEEAGQADAVMVMAFDTGTGAVTAIGIPRDSMVDVTSFGNGAFTGINTLQLCYAFAYGDGHETSCEYTATAASRILYNIPINYYFALDESGIGPLNDAIGGVSLTPLQSIPGTNIVEGQDTVLFGANALKYVQWRDISELDSPLDRQARQMQYIKAFAAQALQLSQGSIGTLVDLYNTTAAYSITNLGVNEFSYLATSVLQNGITGLDVITLTGEMTQGAHLAEFYLDKTFTYETVLKVFYQQTD